MMRSCISCCFNQPFEEPRIDFEKDNPVVKSVSATTGQTNLEVSLKVMNQQFSPLSGARVNYKVTSQPGKVLTQGSYEPEEFALPCSAMKVIRIPLSLEYWGHGGQAEINGLIRRKKTIQVNFLGSITFERQIGNPRNATFPFKDQVLEFQICQKHLVE